MGGGEGGYISWVKQKLGLGSETEHKQNIEYDLQTHVPTVLAQSQSITHGQEGGSEEGM